MKSTLCFIFALMLSVSVCRGAAVEWNDAWFVKDGWLASHWIGFITPNGAFMGGGIDVATFSEYATLDEGGE